MNLVKHPHFAAAARRLTDLGLGFVVADAQPCTDLQDGKSYAMVRVDFMGPPAGLRFWRDRGPISSHFAFGNQSFFVAWVERVEAWLADEQMADAA